MARIIHNQTNFTAGELTPRMKGRGDVARYQNGADVIENGFVVVHGGVVRRWGQRFLAEAKFAGDRAVRMIRFVASIEQSYCLEFGHGYIRVFDGPTGAVVLNDALDPVEIASPYTEDQLSGITTRQDADAMLLFHEAVPTQLLRRLSGSQWALYPVPWVAKPFAELGHDPDARLSLSAATVGAGRTFTTTPTAVPGAPTIGTAYPLNAAASVNFTPPADSGGVPATKYVATSTPGGITAEGTISPIRIGGLTNGISYTFAVHAVNSVGAGAASAASNAVTPDPSLQSASITATVDTTDFAETVENGPASGIAGPTASGTGGLAPYTVAWSILSGSPGLSIERANTAQVLLASTNYGAVNYATLRALVTDQLGAQGFVDVNVAIRHRAFREPGIPPGGVIP